MAKARLMDRPDNFVCAERYEYQRIPFFIVADNQTGEIVFETSGNMTVNTELESMSVGKKFPKTSRYVFDNGDRKAEFNVSWKEILEIRDTYGNAPENKADAMAKAKASGVSDMDKVVGGTKEQYDAAHIQPTYLRFFTDGAGV